MVAAQSLVTTRDDMEVMIWKADMLFKSDLLPQHIKNAQQVIAIDMMARELNIPTWQAINGINVIQGKPTVSPQLMLALIERSGKLEDIKVDASAEQCTVTMKRRGRSAHTEIFSFKDAQAMQLAGKDNYRKQPAVMLKWRAISACARVVFPDVLMGIYTTEEIAPDSVRIDAEGDFEVIDAPTPSNVLDLEKARKTLGSGEGERRIPQRDIVVTDGNTARQITPEIQQPEETPSPNGTHAPAPSGDVPKDPTPSENNNDYKVMGSGIVPDPTTGEPTHVSWGTGIPPELRPAKSTATDTEDISKWEHYQALMAHESVKSLYTNSVNRKNLLALLKRHGAFNSGKVSSMVWRIQLYHQLRAEGHKEDEAASAAATAPDELEGF